MSAPGLIAMAVYQPDAELLRRQVASIRAQTLTNWRCLIGIDGSDAVARDLVMSAVGDEDRFEVVEFEERLGVYRHFERLLMRKPSDVAWVALADQDDEWYPVKLERLTAELRVPGVSGVSGQARLVDGAGRRLGTTHRRPGRLSDAFLKNQVTGSFSVFTPDVVERALPFPRSNSMTAIHDHWLGVVAAALGDFRLVDEVVQDYVQHGSNVLGEVQRTPVLSGLRKAWTTEGLVNHLDHVSLDRWGWRADMASGLITAVPSMGGNRFIAKTANGRVSAGLVEGCAHAISGRRLRIRDALGVLTAAAWWSYATRRMHGV